MDDVTIDSRLRLIQQAERVSSLPGGQVPPRLHVLVRNDQKVTKPIGYTIGINEGTGSGAAFRTSTFTSSHVTKTTAGLSEIRERADGLRGA